MDTISCEKVTQRDKADANDEICNPFAGKKEVSDEKENTEIKGDEGRNLQFSESAMDEREDTAYAQNSER